VTREVRKMEVMELAGDSLKDVAQHSEAETSSVDSARDTEDQSAGCSIDEDKDRELRGAVCDADNATHPMCNELADWIVSTRQWRGQG